MARRRRRSDTDKALELALGAIFALPVAAVWAVGSVAKSAGRAAYNAQVRASGIEGIDMLDGIGFENFVADLLRWQGYRNVRTTKGSGDYGVDIVADKDGYRYAFQCKHYSSKVGVKAIQEVYSGAKMYNANICMVVTNAYYTPNALELARKLGVGLWDRKTLIQMLGQR